jgi:AP endonuclease-1
VLGSHHKDLRDIIELVEDKTRIGICIDTCTSSLASHLFVPLHTLNLTHPLSSPTFPSSPGHLFASASTHTLSPSTSLHTTLSTLNSHVPLRSYLKALHLNDSKFPVGSKKDRHENLGLGEIGLEGFWALMRWEGPDGERSEEQGQAWWGKGGGGEGVVMVLETPNAENEEVWKREIELVRLSSFL